MGTGRTDEFRKDAVRIALSSGAHCAEFEGPENDPGDHFP